MSKVKYTKVNTADRLPEKSGIYITNLGSLLFYEYEDEEVFKSLRSEKIFSISQIEFWLEEFPDREEEMREMLEECRVQLEFLNEHQERGTTNSVLSRLKTLLNELKQ